MAKKAVDTRRLAESFSNAETREFMAALVSNVESSSWCSTTKNLFPGCFRSLAKALPDDLGPGDLTKEHLKRIVEADKGRVKNNTNVLGQTIALMAKTSKQTGFAFDDDLMWLVERIDLLEARNMVLSSMVCAVICSDEPCRQHILVSKKCERSFTSRTGRASRLNAIATDIASPRLAEDIERALSSFVFQNTDIAPLRRVLGRFWAHSGDPRPMAEADLDAASFDSLLRHFQGDTDASRIVLRIYLALAEERPEQRPLFPAESGITVDFMCNGQFLALYLEGYRAVVRCLEDPAPEWDLWHLYPGAYAHRSAEAKPNVGIAVDVRVSSTPQLQRAFKEWAWSEDVSPRTLSDKVSRTKRLLEAAIAQAPLLVKDGREIPVLSAEGLFGALAERRGSTSLSHLGRTRRELADFVRFAEARGALSVEPACYIALDKRAPAPPPPHSIEPAGRKGSKKLLVELEARSGESDMAALCHTVFRLTQITTLRISQVLDLKTDSVVEIGRKGLYKVEGLSKGRGAAKENTQIDLEAKTLIDKAILLTEPLRRQASRKVKPYVFLTRARNRHIRCLNDGSYNKYLEKVCREVGIPTITTENVRKRRFTDVTLMGDEEGLSRAEMKALDPHARRSTTDRHYLRPTIREYLLAVYGIEFDGIEVAGTIADEGEAGDDADLVEGGCGWCRNDCCKVQGAVSCLMCRGFWTTPAHIPEFKGLIGEVERRIAACEVPHDKKHLVAVKRLCVEYLALLLEKKGPSL